MIETKVVPTVPGREDERPVDRLNEFIITSIRMDPDLPPWIPPPLEVADVKWLRGDEGCQVVSWLVKGPKINAKDLFSLVRGPSTAPEGVEVPHFRKRLSRFVAAGIFQWVRGRGQEKLFFANPALGALRTSCSRYFEQKLAALDDQASRINRLREECRKVIRDLREG